MGKVKKKPPCQQPTEMQFYEKLEYYELMNWLALHPFYAMFVLLIVSKELKVSQRVIEYTQTIYAKKYNLLLNQGRYDVQEKFRCGPRKDPNCRGKRFPIPYRDAVYKSTNRQLPNLIFVVAGGFVAPCFHEKVDPTLSFQELHEKYQHMLGPLLVYILQHYEMIKNDLNAARELLPQKKDVSHISRPQRQPIRPAAWWRVRR
jgi:hypothetical protein